LYQELSATRRQLRHVFVSGDKKVFFLFLLDDVREMSDERHNNRGTMREWNLTAESELRCEVREKESLSIILLEGGAEIFGVELAVNLKYNFHDENIAIFTWTGCKLRTEGNCESLYTSSETPMVSIVNVNSYLETRRDVAMANGDNGPRVGVPFCCNLPLNCVNFRCLLLDLMIVESPQQLEFCPHMPPD
jgi:hypothetical protein